jgi:nicotinic acid mononucleotide adenylyltransferase
MQEKMLQEFNKDLINRLTDKQLLKAAKLSKKAMLELIQLSDRWKEDMKEILEKDKISCKDVLILCEKALSSLCDEPKEGWLHYIYDDILKQLFPGKTPRNRESSFDAGRLFYLEVLRFFLQYEIKNRPFSPRRHMELLTEEEFRNTDTAGEYRRLLHIIQEQYIYEFMRIGSEITRHKTLAHIAGVHFICMHVGRQLSEAGVPIDLALVSGAAFGHDIGKYGCKPEESKRIPYLHYYYTDKYFKRNRMPSIGHIATNHSTWDLELENLSAESLVLIYADFRVKSEKEADGREVVKFFSLDDAFQVILDKLDNVDDAKRDRYVKVYAKLKDFEEYMEGLGINTDLSVREIKRPEKKDASLFNPEEAVRSLKHLAIRHNIIVMHKFNSEASFSVLVEAARSEKNWKNMRAYINIFQEYCTYMTQKQKLMTLNFLYELLMHREGDIRRQAASLIGDIIIRFDVEYRKELPEGVKREPDEVSSLDLWEKYLRLIILPDHKVTEQHRRWLGYTLKLIVGFVLEHCKETDANKYLDTYLKYFMEEDRNDSTAFVLLDSIHSLPLSVCTKENRLMLMKFTARMALKESIEVRIAALRFIVRLTEEKDSREECLCLILECLDKINTTGEAVMEFLIYKILSNLGLDDKGEMKENFDNYLSRNPGVSSEIFLQNLKAATPWVMKVANLDLLYDQIKRGSSNQMILQVAAHLSNLVKVSERVAVRHRAGEALLAIISMLTLAQRNEIAVELSKGLEIGEYEFSKYIPQYLGEIALYLHPNELDELILDFKKMLNSNNDRICSVTLDTLGVMLQNYAVYQERFLENDGEIQKRREVILGLILKGLSNYHETVSQEAFLVVGQYFFGSCKLSLDDKYRIFSVIYKKMLTLITDQWESELSFFNSAASLNHIYRFILEYLFHHKGFALPVTENVAFFPGSFDPFSLGHKGIINGIRNLGFEVYLAVDEFFWSKKTQPKMIRRQIISMSIADEKNVFLFPDEIPINIGSPPDLLRLKSLFPNRNVYITVGSDVIEKASSYLAPQEEGSVHNFPHIVFNRNETDESDREQKHLNEQKEYPMLSSDIKCFSLPPNLEEISAVKIRENIDSNRDISNLIDPLVQSFIYDNSLYLREPLFKHVFSARRIQFEIVGGFGEKLADEVTETIFRQHENRAQIRAYLLQKGTQAVIVRDGNRGNAAVGITTFHEIGMADLYDEFGSLKLSSYIRSITSGKIIVLTGIASIRDTSIKNTDQLTLTEALAYCLKNDFTYAMFHNHLGETDKKLIGLLERQGFLSVYKNGSEDSIYAVDMKFPVTFYSDIETTVKEPFNQRQKVLSVIEEAHRKSQQTLAKLYPGNLILTVDSGVMNHRIVDMITEENRVPNDQGNLRELGEYMCVPFGKLLRGMAVPNTVTKSLQTEKRFESGVNEFQITEYPYYSPLITQIRTIKSFRRPVLLVDDMLHKGYRMKVLDPILRQEEIDVRKTIVGILSGRGKDLMTLQGRQVDSVYFIPNLRSWFVESSLYPFLGGDGIRREEIANAGIIPSVNLILPYVAPNFMMDLPRTALYDFSLTCLENTKNILTALEEEYQQVFERNLTLNRLSEAVISPRYPDKGLNMNYDMNIAPSVYVQNDIEHLKQLENLILMDLK